MSNSDDTPQRILVVVWHWDKSNITPIAGGTQTLMSDEWSTDQGDLLVRTSYKNTHQDTPQLVALITHYAQQYPLALLTVMLHSSQPHYFDDTAAATLQTSVPASSERVKYRIFGNAVGAIYCRTMTPLGILGSDGEFPGRMNRIDEQGQKIRVDFLADMDQRRIPAAHFDFVWNYYWHAPRQQILALAHELNKAAFGYRARAADSGVTPHQYIQQHPQLWEAIQDFSKPAHRALPNHYDAYHSFLAAKAGAESEFSDTLDHTRTQITELLDKAPGPAFFGDAIRILTSLYNRLPQKTTL